MATANLIPYPNPGYDRLSRYPSGIVPRCRPYGPNMADDCLETEYKTWNALLRSGALAQCCPQGRKKYTSPPWVTMPSEGRPFRPIEIQPLTAFQTAGLFNGVDTIVLQERVPLGYDGVISEVVCNFTGNGFAEGSGDILWRLAADYMLNGTTPTARWLRDMGNIRTSLGSLTQPSPIPRGGFRVWSWDLITFYANIPATSPIANGNIICSIKGWFYPR